MCIVIELLRLRWRWDVLTIELLRLRWQWDALTVELLGLRWQWDGLTIELLRLRWQWDALMFSRLWYDLFCNHFSFKHFAPVSSSIPKWLIKVIKESCVYTLRLIWPISYLDECYIARTIRETIKSHSTGYANLARIIAVCKRSLKQLKQSFLNPHIFITEVRLKIN